MNKAAKYICASSNGSKVKVFIDSGAEATYVVDSTGIELVFTTEVATALANAVDTVLA